MQSIPHPTELGKIYTEDEAAARLHVTRRFVITLGKRSGCCSVFGRTIRFSEQDLLDLWQVMRSPVATPRRPTVHGDMPQATSLFFRELARKEQQKREEKLRARLVRQAEERTRRAEAKAAARREALAIRERAKQERQAVKRRQEAEPAEPLEYNNRDPAYWTEDRKLRLRLERVARMKEQTALGVTGRGRPNKEFRG